MYRSKTLFPVVWTPRAATKATGLSLAREICRRLKMWLGRWRQRRALGRLDDRLLDDIGVTREQAERECNKPFWKA